MTDETATTESLRREAQRLLSEGTVGMVIGYAGGNEANMSVPFFARSPEDARKLVFDDLCLGNLSVYLHRPHVRRMGRTGIVLKGCDLRAVNVLLRENVIRRDEVVLIGVRCGGVGAPPLPKCAACDCRNPEGCDVVVGERLDQPEGDPAAGYAAAAAVEEMSLEQRWEFWRKHLGRCIRCYACRQACPLCYCKRCIIEKSVPQWVETSAHLQGNIAWNVARALHLVGRCVGCGECERVCPMDIPLTAINQKMARLVEERFGFRSGMSAEEQSPFTTFSIEDSDEGIL